MLRARQGRQQPLVALQALRTAEEVMCMATEMTGRKLAIVMRGGYFNANLCTLRAGEFIGTAAPPRSGAGLQHLAQQRLRATLCLHMREAGRSMC